MLIYVFHARFTAIHHDHDPFSCFLRFLCAFFFYDPSQKLIKELPSLVPSDENKAARNEQVVQIPRGDSSQRTDSPASLDDSLSCTSSQAGLRQRQQQQHGDKTAEKAKKEAEQQQQEQAVSRAAAGVPSHDAGSIGKSPGEVAFFKLLHAEFKKATHFFDRATEEFTIREERVSEGMTIMKQPNSIMVNEKWSLMAKSIYRLYKDLLLLETFAIMTYCSFSKILKKHDKVTGYETRIAFMSNVVNKANFTNYPKVLEMINRCERLYSEVSENLLREGKEGLYEDERLFINMIHRLNEQVLSSDGGEIDAERKAPRRPVSKMPASDKESQATSTLRSIVEDNEKSERPAQVADPAHVSEGYGCDADDDDSSDDSNSPKISKKRQVCTPSSPSQTKKKRAV